MAQKFQNQRKPRSIPDSFEVVAKMVSWAVAVVIVVLLIAGVFQIIHPAIMKILEMFSTVTDVTRRSGFDDGIMGLGYFAIFILAIVAVINVLLRRR